MNLVFCGCVSVTGDLLCTFPLRICFCPPDHVCVRALKAERSRTLRDSLAGAVFGPLGFVPDGGESGGLIISLMLCVDQGHGTV